MRQHLARNVNVRTHRLPAYAPVNKAIAAKLGVSIGTVTNHLKKHGLTGKRGRPAKKK